MSVPRHNADIGSFAAAFFLCVRALENPYFAVSDAHGRYSIQNVPSGTYTLVAWQERLPKDTRVVEVPESGDLAGINFTLGPKNLPKH